MGINFPSRRVVILTQIGLVQVREVEVIKFWRRKYEERGRMAEEGREHENFSKSDVTSVTSTRLDPFCPAVSERSIAEFERNGWSRAYDGAVVVVRAKGERQPKCGNVPNAEQQKRAILGRGAIRNFPWHAIVPEAVALVVPRTSHAAEVCISNVIDQNVYLIR